MKKILVIGQGFLGSNISNAAKIKNFEVFKASRTNNIKINIKNIREIETAVIKLDPDVVINCAAITNLDTIEKKPKDAYEVNAYGAKNIAEITSKYSKRLIHISTDSVFDGNKGNYDEMDTPNPINEYSKSKKLGEDLVKENSKDFVIVRTNFYGNNNEKKFLFNWILKNLKQKKQFSGFTNIFFNPLDVQNLSRCILELAELKYIGILHIGSDKIYSKYEFAKIIAEKLKFDTSLVIGGDIEDLKLIAKRPHNTSLNNKLAKQLLKNQPQNLEPWLDKMKNLL